ncbi:succinate-semialdehyde dehydrogenase/glutarate-semialdehyde dehydrogenase [Anaerosolibacter carboniphilus]|uniref:Succinate-semialdehyde dehydrogenase/glutarate-semialdehyde dehydrogenase n=1 Tax=Anaerosolibacter carboniphilus TaxID=1417629 RepID=A0A841L3N5_9FIRM|nr:succinate-semialdehyde dehydrogenase/glutarate-semialdehyde dehydrogenase [Anaerosolibacter carboniphilus]
MKHYGLYINGEWMQLEELNKIDVINPGTGDIVGTVPNGGEKEAQLAIEAAVQAFEPWAALPANERGNYLKKLYELILEEKEELTRIMTLEQGKPLQEALGEVLYAASFVEWYGEEAKRIYGETIPAWKENKRIMVLKQPIGVVAAITPWNFPAAMVTRKLAPALAAGCTVILKPATQTPLTAMKLFELFEKAGFPKGTVNVVTGSASAIGKAFMEDRRVRKITFTGSTEVGKVLMKQSVNTVKRVSMELGGHAPFIVFDDADLDKAVEGAAASKFRNCGQVCVASNRFYVQENVVEAFIEKLRNKLKHYKVGYGLEEGVNIGPLIDKKGYEKVNQHIEDAVSKGAKIEVGGKGYHGIEAEDAGYFFEPTVLSHVTEDMLIMKEETFGPVMPIVTFKDEEEAIRAANNTVYGLAAYLFTESLSRGIRVSERLEYGIVGLNDGLPSTAQAPFGGFKESGLGREGGHHGLEAFLETKYISMGI